MKRPFPPPIPCAMKTILPVKANTEPQGKKTRLIAAIVLAHSKRITKGSNGCSTNTVVIVVVLVVVVYSRPTIGKRGKREGGRRDRDRGDTNRNGGPSWGCRQ